MNRSLDNFDNFFSSGGGSGNHRLSIFADQRSSRDRRSGRRRRLDPDHSQGSHVQPKPDGSTRWGVWTGQISGKATPASENFAANLNRFRKSLEAFLIFKRIVKVPYLQNIKFALEFNYVFSSSCSYHWYSSILEARVESDYCWIFYAVDYLKVACSVISSSAIVSRQTWNKF